MIIDCSVESFIVSVTHSELLGSKKVKKFQGRLAVVAVNVRVAHVSLGTVCEGWCPSPLPSPPKPFPSLKRVGYPFDAG